MPFSRTLALMAYVSCSKNQREWYNTVPKNVVRIEIQQCCEDLLYPSRNSSLSKNSSDLCSTAAKYNHLKCLEKARILGYQWDEKTTAAAAGNKHLALLINLVKNGCPWDETTCIAAAESGSTNCLMYAIMMECPCDSKAFEVAAANGHLSAISFLFENDIRPLRPDQDALAAAARFGHINCMRYLREIAGVQWPQQAMLAAAAHGRLEPMVYAYSHGYRPDESVCIVAAMNGRLACLRFAHLKGGRLSTTTATIAAKHGQLNSLQYCFENGVKLVKETINAAAEYGQIEIIKYLRGKGCPWDATTSCAAATRGQMQVLKYLYENGCPRDDSCPEALFQFLRFRADNIHGPFYYPPWMENWVVKPEKNKKNNGQIRSFNKKQCSMEL